MISIGQVTANGTASSVLCQVPPGPCSVVLANAGGVTAYVGVTPATGGTLSSSNGIPIAGGASMPFAGYPSSKGTSLSVITAGTATAAVGWLVSRG